MKKIAKIFGKGLLGFLSFLILLAVLIELAVAGAVIWLQAPDGQSWAVKQVNVLTEESDYDITFSGFSYTFPQGLKVDNLAVGDADGVIATLDNAVLRVDFAALMMRHLVLSIDAGTAVVHRLPEQGEEEAGEGYLALSPFILPELYFSSISLKSLNIETLDIREAVSGLPLSMSVFMESAISLSDDPDVAVDMALERGAKDKPWLPEAVRFNGALNLQTLDVQVTRLDVRNDLYNMQVQGSGNLGTKSALDFTLKGKTEDLSSLAPEIEGNVDLTARLHGTLEEPSLSAEGTLVSALLQERGLEDIYFVLRNKNLRAGPEGTVNIQSVYRDMPLGLSAGFAFENSILSLNDIEGEAPDLQVSGAVDVNTDMMLAEGEITLATDNLGFYSTLAGVDMDGTGSAQITLESANGIQGAMVATQLDNIRYETYAIEQATIDATFPDIRKVWPTQMDVQAGNIVANETRIETFNAEIREASGDRYNLTLDAHGRAVQDFSMQGRAELAGLRGKNVSAQNINLTLNAQGSSLTMTGTANPNNLDLTIKTENLTPASLSLDLPPQLENITFSGALDISGTPAAPVMVGDLALSPFSPVEGASVEIAFKPFYRDGRAGMSFTGTGSGITTLNGEASVPLTLSFVPWVFELDRSAPLSGQIDLAASARDLTPFFLPPGHEVRGDIAARAALRGALNAPDLDGTVSFREGEYHYAEYGVQLFNITLDGDLNRDYVQVTNLRATDGKNGALSGNGRASFQNMRNTAMQLRLEDFQLLDSQKAKGAFSADLNLQGREETYLLTGIIRPGQIDILIPEHFRSSIPELNIVKAETSESGRNILEIIEMDVDVMADDRIFVRGWGLDAEFGGQLTATGTLADPKINGYLASRRGRYEEFGRRFNLARANLRFQGNVPPSPYLDIAAVTQVEEIEAMVHLTGELENPALSFSSVPALPNDEIMARILFGRNLNSITPFQAVQLKQSLDRFSGRGGNGFDPLGQLRSITGLDDIRVDTQGDETSVGVGKYLTDEVYLELEKGQGEASSAAKVQIELTPRISLESEVGQDAQAGAGVLWRWDY